MDNHRQFKRSLMLKRVHVYIRHHGTPRLQMFVILCGTALCGFLTSVALYELGFHSMVLRYPLAVFGAYVAFLIFLWLWILYYRMQYQPSTDTIEEVDPFLLSDTYHSMIPSSHHREYTELEKEITNDSVSLESLDFDFEDFVVVLTIIIAIGSALTASIYFIITAPALLAEMMLDGVLCMALYHRFQHIEQHYWLESALTKTFFPFLWLAVVFAITGAILHWYAPEAITIGGVWSHYTSKAHL